MDELHDLVEKVRLTQGRFSLTGKRALVIGGNKGLGQGIALALASAGADVCIAARGPEGLMETVEAIRIFGRNGTSYAVDVTKEANVIELFSRIDSDFGGPDILVNSQGTVHLQNAVDFEESEWLRVMEVNLKSVFLCCKHAGRRMLKYGKGKIINISSVRGFQGRAEDLAYAPSKGALNQLTRSLAIEWGPRGINCNGIAPVFTLTAISAPQLEDPVKRAWVLGRIPMKRLGDRMDLFGPAIFLASDASDFVNGHILPVDGGWLGA